MRARVRLETNLAYGEPVRAVNQVLRMQPRSFQTQHVIDWRVDVDQNCRLRQSEDAFGNIVHSFSLDGPLSALTISVEGEVELNDDAGVIRGQIERLPPDVYLRQGDDQRADEAIRALAAECAAKEPNLLGRLHEMMTRIHQTCRFASDSDERPATPAEVFARGRGSAREIAQVFIAAARTLDIPARFVSGIFLGECEWEDARPRHAWAEAFVADFGAWIGFDPALDYCPSGEHLRLACALDYFGAAPRRGAVNGWIAEKADLRLTVEPERWDAQSQMQQ